MILNNIIIPLKHPYISPEVTFEEMEGESMICTSVGAGGSNVESGETPGGSGSGNIVVEEDDEAKSSTFIWDDEFDINIE